MVINEDGLVVLGAGFEEQAKNKISLLWMHHKRLNSFLQS
jgi:hypothetical protein